MRFLFFNLKSPQNKKKYINIICCICWGLLWVLAFKVLRGDTIQDFNYLMWIIFIVWLSDIGGYIFGKIFKGPKISKYSPNKTFSGVLGSILLSQFAFLFLNYYEKNINYSLFFFSIQFFICLAAIFGDLFFSFIKRKNNIKDYSNLIPGHGGLLDRIDGLIFATFLAFLLKAYDVY